MVVSDGQTLWIYDPAAKEAQEFPVGRGLPVRRRGAVPARRGADPRGVRRALRSLRGETVRLLPASASRGELRALELRRRPRDGRVRETAVVDLFGNRTEVVFESLRSESAHRSRAVPIRGRAGRARAARRADCRRRAGFPMREERFPRAAVPQSSAGESGGADAASGIRQLAKQFATRWRRQSARWRRRARPMPGLALPPSRSLRAKRDASRDFARCLRVAER